MRGRPPFCSRAALLSSFYPAVTCLACRALDPKNSCPPGIFCRMVGPTQSIRLSTLNAVEWWAERNRFLLPFRRAHGDLHFFWWATTVDGGGGVRESSRSLGVDTTRRPGISQNCLLSGLGELELYGNVPSTLMVDKVDDNVSYIRPLFLGVLKRGLFQAPLSGRVDGVGWHILRSRELYFGTLGQVFKLFISSEVSRNDVHTRPCER